jgi:site-specific recombinase XerD
MNNSTTLAKATAGGLAQPTAQENLIQIVLDSVDSHHTKRAYQRALEDFLAWHAEEGRPMLTKALVQRYKTHLEALGRGAASVNQRLSAIRKLASEASDNGLLPEQIASGIQNVSGVRQEGRRTGNWLTKAQAQHLLNAPDVTTLKGLRDRAILAVLLGCGLRRTEAAELTWDRVQQRDGRWALVDIVGKRNKRRTVPMPSWAKVALDAWAIEAGLNQRTLALNTGRVFRSVNKAGDIDGDSLTPQAIRDVVVSYAEALGLEEVAPHDLRRTFAKLARRGGADLEQIQLSLGHASIQTTQRYLGTQQDFADAPADRLGLGLTP